VKAFGLERNLPINLEASLQWLDHGAGHVNSGDGGFHIVARALTLFETEGEDTDPDPWNQVRRMAATTFAAVPLRMASGVDLDKLAVLLSAEEVLELDLASGLSVKDMVAALSTMGPDERSEDLHMYCVGIHIVHVELRRDEPVESVRAISEVSPGDDVGLRRGSLDALAQDVGATFGDDFLPDGNAKAPEDSARSRR
jgi:hypothetical protein